MNIKDYLDKVPLSTKIVGVVLIGVIIIFALYAFKDQRPNQGQLIWDAHERDAAQERKKSEDHLKELMERVEQQDRINLERRKARALEGIRDSLDALDRK